jgi:hypothetical protein
VDDVDERRPDVATIRGLPERDRVRRADDIDVLRRPTAGSMLSPIGGWLTAWGGAALAAQCLTAAGVTLGLGFGIANGTLSEIDPSRSVSSGSFLPSVWMLIIQAGAFLAGGYVAARMARRLGTLHAVAAWVVAMLACGADAIVATIRDQPQVIGALGLPTWVNNGLEASAGTIIAYAILAVGGLFGAILGGMLADAANRADLVRARPRTTDEDVASHEPAVERTGTGAAV